MQVGDLVRYANIMDRLFLALILDKTDTMAKIQWLNHPSGQTFSSWVNIQALEVVG